ncbi:unnamed protein product [Rotaria sordida]|uniref:Uncharacterized protein n=1 Tax=Rotaria sordida TaxID=392033 RepID=A0A818WNI7_9BILA|nr:unnamed protein product [Rotaria sordida]CAF1051747.1 unnamed protein product [Rotaria sordida]CAF1061604.1 unnamed protein product [Rotaria sordida]CAF3710987.1 unnamed protein product [Rotaria sordida]CAF3728505.1 unnamed protein product [Rotaria sordida]
MTEHEPSFNSLQDTSLPLSVNELTSKRVQQQPPDHYRKQKKQLPLQESKPPKNAAKLRPRTVDTHFVWALVLTIFCFFIIGPCWALFKSRQIRLMIKRNELDRAERLSARVYTGLVMSTVFGVFIWVAILFCSVGLLIAGKLLDSKLI